MTFDSQEMGARTGRKVFLYVWRRGERVYRYTSADRDLTINFQKYLAAPITHGEIEQGSTDVSRLNFDVVVPALHEVAVMYRAQAPVDSVVLTIQEHHVDDPGQETRFVVQGRIVSANWDLERMTCTLMHSPSYVSLQRTGLRRKAQILCPHVLYGEACGASRETFKLTTTVAAITGVNVTAANVSAKPSGYYDGGYIQYLIEVGVYERRGIKAHASGTLQLSSIPIGLLPGMAIDVFPGCDHTTGQNGCLKFSNLPNYGGFPHFPEKNPFDSDPVY